MAYTVSQNFKTAVKDETVRKSCLILFGDLFFDSTDITEEGVTIEQYFNTSDDLTFGDCPSDTLSFSVVSNGNLAGYGFGKARAFLGVQTATAEYAFGDINAHIEVGGNIYTASESGLYRNSTKIDNGVYVSLVSDGTTVYAVGTSSSVIVNNASGTVSAYTPNRFMAQKLRSGLSAVFSANTAYVWDGENVLTFEYVPMGVYNVVKPRSTVGDVVTIQDAYDNMALFDRDAAEFINSLSYPRTLAQIYTALCDYVGVSYSSSTFTYSTTNYSSSPFSDTQCTLRDILWWIAERARRVAHFNRTGVLELLSINTTVQETLTANDIGQDGYSVAEYATPAVTGVLLRGSAGNSLTFGTLDTAYVISANPFVSNISVSDLQAYMAIPTYVPIQLSVLEADPSIDIGDFISIKPMVDEVKVLTNVYDEIYVNSDHEAYAVGSPTYAIPLMNRALHFNGGIRAEYTATGNEQREADLDNTEYNADVAANMARDYTDKLDESLNQQSIFNRLTNNGQAQGIFLDNNGDLYINGTYIQAHTVAVDRLTGTVANGNWGINFDTGVMTIGTLNADNINGGTISGSSINLGSGNFVVNGSTGAVTIKSGSINLGNGVFVVTNTGKVTASNISATGGSIGGWDITSTQIQKRTATTGGYRAAINAPTSATASNRAFFIADETGSSTTYPFSVFYDGSITATKATISGTLIAESGSKIAGWNVSASSIYKDSPAGTSGTATTQGRAYLYTPDSLTPTTTAIGVQIREWDGSSYGDWKYPFGVRYNGELYATKAVISGTLTAKDGSKIAGWNLTSAKVYKDVTLSGSTYQAFMNAPASPTSGNAAFGLSKTTSGTTTYPFYVNYGGKLHAEDAEITGTITSSSATITGGSFKITTADKTSTSYIKLTYSTNYYSEMSAGRLVVRNSDNAHQTNYEGGGVIISDYSTSRTRSSYTVDGITFWNASGTAIGTYSAYRDSGFVASWSVPANSTATKTISFARTFPSAPEVFVHLTQSANNAIYGSCNLSVYDITTTGFTVRAFNNTSTAAGMPFSWKTI